MSETTQDLDALREGLRLVEEWRRTHEDRARMARVEATAEMERRQAGAYAAVAAVVRRELEAPAAGEDVRERVARELAGHRENYDGPDWYDYEVADRILAIFRTPRGEGEAWRAFLDALDEFEAAANLWADPEGPTAADMERLRQSRQRVIECARALAALRSEAQAEAGPEDIARRISRDCRLLFDQTPEEDAELRRALADLAEGIEARLEWVSGPARRGEGGGDARRS